jgi:UDP-N-acetylmuramate--alanine ligase
MYKKNKRIHFMGIGGIGMSGIAAVLKQQGYFVSGCDVSKDSSVLDWLKSLGCKVHFGHDKSHIGDVDVLVYSSAVKKDHPEIAYALDKGIPVIPRAIMLAELMRTKYGIAVSGSHGKTTTTSMISHILTEANLDPTIIIGGVLKNLSTHARLGNGDMLIAEADESDRSLLYLNPSIAIVTNVDAEHLDTYKNLDDVKNTFRHFLERLPFYGKAFVCVDDDNLSSILASLPHIPMVKYGFSKGSHIRGEIVDLGAAVSIFSVYENEKKLGEINMKMPGKHNVSNALAAIGLGLELELAFSEIKRALENFRGVERRFEFKGTHKGAEIFDDYGHHPTEIKNTLLVAKKRANKRLHVVFQPHRYTRTQKLWDEFVETFSESQIDTLFMTSIYPASEDPIPEITSERLASVLKEKNPDLKVFYYPTYEQITDHVSKMLKKGDLFITIGAGKANCVGRALVEKSSKK